MRPDRTDPRPPAFEEARAALLAEALSLVPFDGWSWGMMREAAQTADVDAATLAAAFPHGVGDLLQFWSENLDGAMETAMAAPEVATMKIREKVAHGVKARLTAMEDDKEAARRAAATLALPHMASLGARLVWATSDRLWRALGDTSTDFNFYSKRAILSGVWTSTFARWLADESEDGAPTHDFLSARIENVMQIEKAKATVRKWNIDPAAPISWLAKMRYGSSKS